MGKSIARTRKRRFHGKKYAKAATTASASKLGVPKFVESKQVYEELSGNRIFDIGIILDVISAVCCPSCFNPGLFLEEDSRYGLCSHFTLKCKNCEFIKGFASSLKIASNPEINTRLVYGLRQLGKGHVGASKLCATLNLPPPPCKTAYAKQEKKLLCAVSEVCKESMSRAAEQMKNLKGSIEGQSTECGVSVDGTWQRRGYSSLNGCVTVISIDSGKVLDTEVMSAYCPTCRKLQKLRSKKEYDTLQADHVCHCNYEGSASSMETVGVQRMFRRSEALHGIKYTAYYGDGDSKAYIQVKDVYGKDSVNKFECIGHIQKRVGTHLRKLKKKTKGLSGKGKLTDAFIDRLQNYYGIAIRANVGDLNKMQQNVIAVLFHCASNEEYPMHGQCPLGKDSWCFHQRALSKGETPKQMYKGLPKNILAAVKPVYMKLCSRELLSKCLHGKTQNANESFNGNIWQRVPKSVFSYLKTVRLGAYDAVIQFNDGFKGCLDIFKKLKFSNLGKFTVTIETTNPSDIPHQVPNTRENY